ncbi:MAG TPA: BA14K family protein [Mesorhizobium sp.]|jgi:alkylated DNA repair dioxygenase AlkB|uniref:BA14K family protein n=1 Tax=Mesorhizobium sp. TaxID=1871066 RepID=UPI002DDCB296|nr:BA14K family protein [Mesorhizobium sp.]HEV2503053.1 BA14K family protein [Mesorhizobium sp.]
MKKLISTLCAAATVFTAFATSATPGQAAPMQRPTFETSSDIMQVQNRRGFYRDGNRYYYNGHRGYRDARPGWKRHNGMWFPPAAFIAGAIIGGAIANQGRPVYRPAYPARLSNAHVRWCYDRYRSYRVSDNTFQPNYGPRQQCISPYR